MHRGRRGKGRRGLEKARPGGSELVLSAQREDRSLNSMLTFSVSDPDPEQGWGGGQCGQSCKCFSPGYGPSFFLLFWMDL